MIKALSSLIAGNFIGFLIGFGTIPFLSRIYSPTDFGQLAIFISFNSLIIAGACGRYDLAIIAANKNSEIKNLIDISIIILTLSSFVWLVIILTIKPFLRIHTNLSNIELLLSPIYVFASAGLEIFKYYYSKKKMYKYFSIILISNAALLAIFPCMLKKFNFELNGLILGYVLSNSILFFVLAAQFNLLKRLKKVKYKRLLKAGKKYKSFLLFEAPSAVLNNLTLAAPNFFINYNFGSLICGNFNLATRVVMTPYNIISQSIYQTSIRQLSQIANSGKSCKKAYLLYVFFLVFCCIPPTLIVLFFGDELIIRFLGANWAVAGIILNVMILAFSVQFVASTLSGIIPVLGYPKYIAIWRLLSFFSIYVYFLFFNHQEWEKFFKNYSNLVLALYGLYLWLSWKAACRPKIF